MPHGGGERVLLPLFSVEQAAVKHLDSGHDAEFSEASAFTFWSVTQSSKRAHQLCPSDRQLDRIFGPSCGKKSGQGVRLRMPFHASQISGRVD
jgi:hypothetical protein